MIDLRIGEILKEMGIAGAMAALLDAAKNGVQKMAPIVGEKVADVAGKKISKKLDEEYRGEMLAFLRKLAAYDAIASENLLRRQQDRQFCHKHSYDENNYQPGEEDRYIELLRKLYKSLDQPEEENLRMQTFIWLGRMSDKKFDATQEILHNDVFLQYLQKFKIWFKETGHGVSTAVATHLRPANNAMEQYLEHQRATRGRRQKQYR